MFFAKLHPLIVHFPMGLLVSGALFELYGKLRNEEVVSAAGRFNLRLGFWSAFPVLVVGYLGMLSLENTEKFRSFLGNHILFAFSSVGIFMAALLLARFRSQRGGLYYLLLFLGLCTVLATGFFGGEMVHRFGVSAKQSLI